MNRRGVWLAVLFVMQFAFTGLSQGGQPGSLAVWAVPAPQAFPAGIALDDEGRVYVAAQGADTVYRLDPENDLIRMWGAGEGPVGLIVVEGVVFCTVEGGNLLRYFNPDGLATNHFPLPTPEASPGGIHRGPDAPGGKAVLWIAEQGVPGFARFRYDPKAGAPQAIGEQHDVKAPRGTMAVASETLATDYERYDYDVSRIGAPLPLSGKKVSWPFTEWKLELEEYEVEDLAVADDGTVWISFGSPLLYKFNPATETILLLETVPNALIFQGLLPDPDGSIWFGNILEGSIGHLDASVGLSEEWRIPGAREVFDLAFDNQGRIWYADRMADVIGRFDPATGTVTAFHLPEGSEPLYLVVDDEGTVWFTAGLGNYIGRLVVPD